MEQSIRKFSLSIQKKEDERMFQRKKIWVKETLTQQKGGAGKEKYVGERAIWMTNGKLGKSFSDPTALSWRHMSKTGTRG